MAKPPGLQNIGNTCYFNAVIQSLYRTDVFVDNLQNADASTNTSNNADSSVSVLEEERKSERNSTLAYFWSFFDGPYSKLQPVELKWLFTQTLRVVCFVLSYKAGSSEMFNRTSFAKLLRNVREIMYANVSVVTHIDGRKGHSTPLTFWQHQDSTRTCPLEVTVNPTTFRWYIFPMAITLLAVAYKLLHWTKWRCSCLKKKEIATVFCLSVFCYCAGFLATSLQHSSNLAPYLHGAPVLTAAICFAFYYRSKIVSSLRWAHSMGWRHTSNKESLSSSLSKLFREMNSGNRTGSLNPGLVFEGVCRRAERFYGFRQQDSHDLLRHLLDGIREDERQLNQQRKSLTLVDKVFGGHFRTEYNCLECGTPYFLYESFLDISLPILIHEDTWKEIDKDYVKKMDRNSPFGYPVEFLLKVFTRTENLGNEYLCTACNAGMTGGDYRLTEGTKQTLICDVPAILCIHLKRFKQLASGQGFEKANDPIRFSELLDLKEYLSAKCQRINDGQENVWYSLYAVVVHSGTLEGGHYAAYINSKRKSSGIVERFLQEDGFDWDQIPKDTVSHLQGASSPLPNVRLSEELAGGSQWYYTSDSTVRAVNKDEVFKQQAYLLFYERLC